MAALLGLALVCPWAVAAWLRPDGRGHGTHQQLGLPPCSFEVLFGQRCPTCGSTTAFAHLIRGHLLAACRANVGGTLLGVLVAVGGPWLLACAARGRWIGLVPTNALVAWLAGLVAAAMLVDWAVRLVAFG
ncbi:MAG: DUF2752 domain-containing protein [Pirellulales bacterium]|nr:DUF2752 domain-containing protein [Pirellulales bacterium]